MKTIFFVFFIALAFSSIHGYSQVKYYHSYKNVVTIANGNSTNVSNDKSRFFKINMFSQPEVNNIGHILIQDIPFDSKGYTRNYFENFRIYSVKLNDNGVYNYWTIDIGQDGQTVLFQVDFNGAIPQIVMSRYSPIGNDVLKRIVYYIE